MSLATNVSDGFTAVGTEVKRTRTWINGNAADLSALTTTAKSDLVAAVNEVKITADAAAGGGIAIDDTQARADATWSSSKIDTELDGKAATAHTHASGDVTGLAAVATSGSYTDLTATPTIPSTYDELSGTLPASDVTGLSAVATSGSYADLSATPAIPSTYADLSGTVPAAALPSLAITEYLGEVASEAAMLALVGQRGDWATRTDLGTDWILTGDDASLIGSWREMTTPASPVSSVNGRTGAVTGLAEAANVGDHTTDFVAAFTAALA